MPISISSSRRWTRSRPGRTGTGCCCFLDTDQNASSGWLGYDFIVNLEVPNDTETRSKAWRAGSGRPSARLAYRVNGNGHGACRPAGLVGQDRQTPAFDFHWAENLQDFGDASDLDLAGDSAPDARWNYRFEVAPR